MSFGSPPPVRVAPTPPPPAPEDKDVQKRRAARLTASRFQQGFSSTIATDRMNPQGSLGSTATPGSVTKLG